MKITKTQLKQIIKEELEAVNENIDANKVYYISGEDIIELRNTLSELDMWWRTGPALPDDKEKSLVISIKYMRTLLSPPNIRGPAK
tara:strand:- start:1338 stop:1595 length:258 start_codon:yes stop_codon:yes gene_type:complete